MPVARRSPLFSAVVVAGASLTQTVAGCGAGVDPSETEADASVATPSDGGPTDAARDGRSPFTPPDASASPDAESCPDGSDRPVPPCHLIK